MSSPPQNIASNLTQWSALFSGRYIGRRVMVTGHTGFKGGWLSHWLTLMGAEVHGLALDPDPNQTLFSDLCLSSRLASDRRMDVRDADRVRSAISEVQPEFLFHLAAQPLVRLSYEQPVETFATNVLGTAHVLDALTRPAIDCNVVIVTTDKCYENREWESSYRESDAMGGHDPYSASKGCAELVASSYRRSFAKEANERITRIATARAGNVIGGGDWSVDRIVPDVFRALRASQPVVVRNRTATRPWQHVLEPLSGYLWLGAALDGGGIRGVDPVQYEDSFNFGPALASNRTVAELVEQIGTHVDLTMVDRSDPKAVHEAGKLNLAIDRAFHRLGWQPVWDFNKTVAQTATFYRDAQTETLMEWVTEQTATYIRDAAQLRYRWAVSMRDAVAA